MTDQQDKATGSEETGTGTSAALRSPSPPTPTPRRGLLGRIAQFPLKVLAIFVILEPIWMLLPFAGFLYGSGLQIQVLARHSQTAWLTHFVFPVLTLGLTGPVMVVVGFGIFLVGAGQIYWAKFRKTGMVTRGLYRWVRHPQYTALTLFGVGLLLAWGRAIMFLAFFGMMFLYYYLAKDEERRCVALFGAEYEAYRDRTSFCFPGDKALTRLLGRLPAVPLWKPLRPVAVFILTAALAMGLLWLISTIRIHTRTVPFMTTAVKFGPLPKWVTAGPDLRGGRAGGVPFVVSEDRRVLVVRGPWRNASAPGFAETVLRRVLVSDALAEFLEFLDEPSRNGKPPEVAIIFCTPLTPPKGDAAPGERFMPKDSHRRGPEPDPDGPDRIRLILMRCAPAAGATIIDAVTDKAKRTVRTFCIAKADLSRADDRDIVINEPRQPGPGFSGDGPWDRVMTQLAQRESLLPKPKNTPLRDLPRPSESTDLILVQAPVLRTRIQPESWFGRGPGPDPSGKPEENHFARDILNTLASSASFRQRLRRFGAGGELVPVVFPRPGPNWYRQHRVSYHQAGDGRWERRGAKPQISVFVMLVRRAEGIAHETLFDESRRDRRNLLGAFIAELDFGIEPPADPVHEIVIIGPRRDLEERWTFFLSGL